MLASKWLAVREDWLAMASWAWLAAVALLVLMCAL